MAKYKVTTEKGTFIVTTEDAPAKESSLMDKAKGAYAAYKDSPLYKASPQGVLEKTNELVRKGFDVAGEKTAEFMGAKGVNPNVAAGVGTAIQMAPDIAMTAATPRMPENLNAGAGWARRHLGIQKSMVKTPFARREADLAARVAMEEKLIPPSGDPYKTFDAANKLANESGSKIGKTLKKIKFEDIAPEAEYDIERFRREITKGTKKGLFAGANQPIDTVKTTILEMYGRDMTAKEYNSAKNILGKSLNYLSDQSSQSVNKRLVNNMANTIKETVKKLVPDDYATFLENKRKFNASQMMIRGLNNELAGQEGNMAASLPSLVMGAADSNPVTAAGRIALTEFLKRRGAGILANQAPNVGKFMPNAAVSTADLLDNLNRKRKRR